MVVNTSSDIKCWDFSDPVISACHIPSVNPISLPMALHQVSASQSTVLTKFNIDTSYSTNQIENTNSNPSSDSVCSFLLHPLPVHIIDQKKKKSFSSVPLEFERIANIPVCSFSKDGSSITTLSERRVPAPAAPRYHIPGDAAELHRLGADTGQVPG